MKNKRISNKEGHRHDQQNQALLGNHEDDEWPKNIKTISIVLSSILIVSKFWVLLKKTTKYNDFTSYVSEIRIQYSIFLSKVVGLASCCTLLWNRIEWGFQEWIHEAMFFNFWNGTYIVLSGKSMISF